MKKIFLLIGAAVLTVAICLSTSSCASIIYLGSTVYEYMNNNQKDNGDTNTPILPNQTEGEQVITPSVEEKKYVVTVKNAYGKPMEGITVFIHRGDGYSVDPNGRGMTDSNGYAEFYLTEGKTYSVELRDIPFGYEALSGYTIKERYQMDGYDTTIVLSLSEDTNVRYDGIYMVANYMANFSAIDMNGNEYKLSEMLSEKKMVMLNFWFTTCSPCKSEMPYISNAYTKYGDSAVVLAINDTGESRTTVEAAISSSEWRMSFSPCLATDYEYTPWLTDFDGSGAYPTTVIIDRYGTICAIYTGGIESSKVWNNVFEYFTADEYEQTVFSSNDEFISYFS